MPSQNKEKTKECSGCEAERMYDHVVPWSEHTCEESKKYRYLDPKRPFKFLGDA